MSILKKIKDVVQGKSALADKRSPQWPKVRTAHLAKHPACAVCGSIKTLEVHHIVPFNVDPTRELDPKNLITLCEAKSNGVTCHQFFGHLGNYQSFNRSVVKDASKWSKKLKNRPK